MTYVKTQLPTLKTHVVNLKRDAKDLSRDLQRLEVRGKLGSKTLYFHDSKQFTSLPQNCHIRYGLNKKRGRMRLEPRNRPCHGFRRHLDE